MGAGITNHTDVPLPQSTFTTTPVPFLQLFRPLPLTLMFSLPQSFAMRPKAPNDDVIARPRVVVLVTRPASVALGSCSFLRPTTVPSMYRDSSVQLEWDHHHALPDSRRNRVSLCRPCEYSGEHLKGILGEFKVGFSLMLKASRTPPSPGT